MRTRYNPGLCDTFFVRMSFHQDRKIWPWIYCSRFLYRQTGVCFSFQARRTREKALSEIPHRAARSKECSRPWANFFFFPKTIMNSQAGCTGRACRTTYANTTRYWNERRDNDARAAALAMCGCRVSRRGCYSLPASLSFSGSTEVPTPNNKRPPWGFVKGCISIDPPLIWSAVSD